MVQQTGRPREKRYTAALRAEFVGTECLYDARKKGCRMVLMTFEKFKILPL